MKDFQWKMNGKPIQTEKQKNPKKKQKNPKKIRALYYIYDILYIIDMIYMIDTMYVIYIYI